MESAEQRRLMLEMMGELYLLDGQEILLLPGKDTRLMADYHSPYDVEVQIFVFVTTEEEIERVGFEQDSRFTNQRSGRVFQTKNISPDETYWAKITAAWVSDNVAP